jgi:hypothetical protein
MANEEEDLDDLEVDESILVASPEDVEEISSLPVMEMMKLDKDLLMAVATMGPRAARMLVYLYYIFQEDRKRAGNQRRKLKEANEPSEVIDWFYYRSQALENQCKIALQKFAESGRISRWSMSLCGVGPVISAGLRAHIDIDKAPSVGHIFRFAGLVPGQIRMPKERTEALIAATYKQVRGKPEKDMLAAGLIAAAVGRRPENFLVDALRMSYKKGNEKRNERGGIILSSKGVKSAAKLCTWNQDLKTLCWKIGDCFVKFSNKPDCFYGHLFREQWAKEKARNEAGDFKQHAADILAEKSGKKAPGKTTAAYEHYLSGKLPPGHILARARRWTVKLFLSHWHFKARTYAGLPAPRPYALDHLGHTDFIEPPPDVD